MGCVEAAKREEWMIVRYISYIWYIRYVLHMQYVSSVLCIHRAGQVTGRKDDKMIIEVKGEALKVLEDFVKYAKLEPEEMSAVMMYDFDGFQYRVRLLEKALENPINKQHLR